MKNLAKFPLSQLNDTYAVTPGAEPGKTFRRKADAIREIESLLSTAEAAPQPKAPKNPWGHKIFEYAPKALVKAPKGSTSKRARVLAALLADGPGLTLQEIAEMDGVAWDRATAYEGTKLLHVHLGFGLRQDADGRIRAYGEVSPVAAVAPPADAAAA